MNFSPKVAQKSIFGWNFKNLSLDLTSATFIYCLDQFSGNANNFEFFGPNFPKKEFWARNSKNVSLHSESASRRYYVHQFSDKTHNFEFLALDSPKKEFWNRNFTNLGLNSESAFLNTMWSNFQTKQTTLNVSAEICIKMDFRFEKFKSRYGISILDLLWAPIIRQTR